MHVYFHSFYHLLDEILMPGHIKEIIPQWLTFLENILQFRGRLHCFQLKKVKLFGGLKMQIFANGFQSAHFLQTIPLMSLSRTCENWSYAHVYYVFSQHARSVSLHSDIAIYWPDMNDTAFLIVLADPCEPGSFPQHCRHTRKTQSKFCSVFSTLLPCKCTLNQQIFKWGWCGK